jgi:DNA polymerase V
MSLVKILVPKNSEMQIPLFTAKVPAGFPSPAQEYLGDTFDLNDYLIKDKSSTFFAKVEGDSMIDAGIFEDDIVVVDKSKKPKHNDIVIAAVDNDFTLKRLSIKNGIKLIPANKNYQDIVLKGESELLIWGVVIALARRF